MCKLIRIPSTQFRRLRSTIREIFACETGEVSGIEIRYTARGIRDPAYYWNTELLFNWQ